MSSPPPATETSEAESEVDSTATELARAAIASTSARRQVGLGSRAPDSDASSALSEQGTSDGDDADDGGDSDVEVNQLLVDSLALIESTVGPASTPPPPPVAAPGEKIKRPSKPWTNDEDALLWSLLERRRSGETGLRNATIFSYFGFRTTSAVGQRISFLNRSHRMSTADAITMESAASSIGGVPSDDENDENDPDPAPVAPTPSTGAATPAAQSPLPALDKKQKKKLDKKPKKRASSAIAAAKPALPKKNKRAVGPFTLSDDDDDDDASMSEGPVASTSAAPKKVSRTKAAPKAAAVKALPFDEPPAASSSTATGKPGKTISSYFKPLVQGPTPPESDREDAWTVADDNELVFQGTVMFKDGVPEHETDVKWQWLAYQMKKWSVLDCRHRFLKLAAERNNHATPTPVLGDSEPAPKKSKASAAASAASSRRSTKEPASKPSSTASSKGKGKAAIDVDGSGEAPKSKKRPSSAGLEGAVGKKSRA